MKKVFKFLLCALLAWAAFRFILESAAIFKGLDNETLYLLGGGVLAGALFGVLSMRNDFYRTLEHELTHIIFALLFFRKPDRLVVRRGSGEAAYSGEHNIAISLAPYFFPLTAFVAAMLSLIVQTQYAAPFKALFAAAITYHILAALFEMAQSQPDIKAYGSIFSTVVVFCLFAFVSLLLSSLTLGKTEAILDASLNGLYSMREDAIHIARTAVRAVSSVGIF